MNLSNKDIQILKHVIRYCEKIESTVRRFGEDFDTFLNDPDYRDSVGMNLLQIGELAGKLSAEYVASSGQNWRAIKNMRNMFAHDYGSMDVERIWDTAIADIPILKAACQKELEPQS